MQQFKVGGAALQGGAELYEKSCLGQQQQWAWQLLPGWLFSLYSRFCWSLLLLPQAAGIAW